MGIRLCIDVGGTFTDIAVVNEEDGKLNIFKTSTTPENFTEGVINGLQMAADHYKLSMEQFMRLCSSHNRGAIIHGTTIATNAIIQKKVAKVGLICTKGHMDILTFREGGGKQDPFFWDVDYPDPYVPRYLTLPVNERVNAQGDIIVPLDDNEVRESIRRLMKYNVEVIAVALLWSISNPIHENRVAEIIDEEFPNQRYVLSHVINPIIREYRRTISTVINASLLPVVEPYIKDFDEHLESLGYEGRLCLISSFGGIVSIKDITEKPIYIVDSGPSCAPVAGILFGKLELENNNVVTCDMGGTSFDVSRVTGGEIKATTEAKIDFDHLGIRKVDTKSIGSGGGSIAWVDQGGLLHVGPQSAGAQPGPACYKKGGTKPTTTDANLILGYLNPDSILGGKMVLDQDIARKTIKNEVAEPLGLNILEAAFSIWSTVCANMTDAIRTITSWEGIDPREYAFVSGGGAAGMHIIPMMGDLGVSRLIIPRAAGVLSAVGGLSADMVSEFQRNCDCSNISFDYAGVNKTLGILIEKATSFLDSNRVKDKDRVLEFFVDARYYSQPWDLTIQIPIYNFRDKKDVSKVVERFHEIHQEIRGSKEEGQFIEFTNWRIKAIGKMKDLELTHDSTCGNSSAKNAIFVKRMAFFKELGGMTETAIYEGTKLLPGNRIEGPSIIEEATTTIVVTPGSEVLVSPLGNYLVQINPG